MEHISLRKLHLWSIYLSGSFIYGAYISQEVAFLARRKIKSHQELINITFSKIPALIPSANFQRGQNNYPEMNKAAIQREQK